MYDELLFDELELLLYDELLPDELVVLLYDDPLFPETRGAVPEGLLYVAVDLVELCPETFVLPDGWDAADGLPDDVVLLPRASLVALVLLVPNELLLVVDTRLLTEPDTGLEEGRLLAITRLPDVSRREPR